MLIVASLTQPGGREGHKNKQTIECSSSQVQEYTMNNEHEPVVTSLTHPRKESVSRLTKERRYIITKVVQPARGERV